MSSKKICQANGLTLIETIVAVAIFAVAMSLMSIMIISGYNSYGYIFQQSSAINEARQGIEVMVQEIRQARAGEDGSYPLVQADDYQFIFFSDVDRDDQVEKVRYFLSGSDLKKGLIKPSGDPPQYLSADETITTLSKYVRNSSSIPALPIFTYFNGSWPGDTINNPLPTLTRLTETKLMHVDLMINVDPDRAPDNYELQSDTQIRNLKTNL
ncbi:type II secretion system GspH family protein [Patescibacteria group bacterium]|nr:type II secretion system GspH family protein [Patescibacteria group bacterium]MBU2220110.1 type II secretion system GspH family protein [Patescibacteria group bacterium]MBU2264758.1 type II secretion system GspH family protein [Patescibacteria group bacterium]